MESLDDLPAPHDLKKRLREWQERYDMWEPWSENKVAFDVEEFSRAGLKLAQEVKAHLPNWTVIYFDEAAAAGKSPDAPRETFEYEVKY